MADPFSIISLLGTAASLTKAVLNYASAVADAPKEVEKLRQSLTSLVDVSEQLIDLMEDEDVKEEFGEGSTPLQCYWRLRGHSRNPSEAVRQARRQRSLTRFSTISGGHLRRRRLKDCFRLSRHTFRCFSSR